MITSNQIEANKESQRIIDLGKKVEVKEWKENRSNLQNRYYWLCMACISEHTGYTKDELHEYFKDKYLEKRTMLIFGKYHQIPSTKKLNTKEFSAYMERIVQFSHVELECILPDPSDINFHHFVEHYKNYI